MIAGLKPYARTKDSGVTWLGAVPTHWEVRRLKYLLRETDSRSQTGKEQLLRVSQYTGITQRKREDGSDGPDTRASSLIGYKLVKHNDLAVNIMLAWNGSLGVSPYAGIVSPAYGVYRFNPDAEPMYYHHLLRSPSYKARIKTASRGVVESRLRLYTDDLYRIEALVPPKDEQAAIARFLDHADRRIRKAIRVKQRLIKLLEKLKAAIIYRAVTRGLDPDVRLKSSGVEWLGDVPEHWEVLKLRQCVSVMGGMTPSMENRRFWDGTIPWVTPKDMKCASLGSSSMRVSEAALRETSLQLIKPPAILMVVRGMILARKVPIAWTTAPVTVNQDMKALIPARGANVEFLAALLGAAQDAFVPLIDEAGHGTRRLPTERWRLLGVALPPQHEQLKIVRFLKEATNSIMEAIDRAGREISLLREYRTRLIADVVTGKLDVREAAARLPEMDEEVEAEADALAEGEEGETEPDEAVVEEAGA